MNGIITRRELIEHYELLPLEYRFFIDGLFVFSTTDSFGTHVSMYISSDVIAFVPSSGVALISEFSRLGKDKLRFLIVNKSLEVVYSD